MRLCLLHLQIEGAIPADLRGTLFRNGPGLLEIGGIKLDQPFDGDGMVLRFTFDASGRVTFRNRYVRTAGYSAEQAAGRMLFKGAFATGRTVPGWFNPFDFNVKNVANTHVVQWGRRLWALWEGGLPHELDPNSLETLVNPSNGAAESNWDGAISGKGPFAAHFKVLFGDDTRKSSAKRLVNFGAGRSGDDAQITFYEFGEDASLIQKLGVTLKGAAFGFFHDFVVTENYYALFANPVRLDTTRLLTQYMVRARVVVRFLPPRPSRRLTPPRPLRAVWALQHRGVPGLRPDKAFARARRAARRQLVSGRAGAHAHVRLAWGVHFPPRERVRDRARPKRRHVFGGGQRRVAQHRLQQLAEHARRGLLRRRRPAWRRGGG